MKMNIFKIIQILICVMGLTACGGSGGSGSNTGGNNNPIVYSISGVITSNATALSGVSITLSGIGSGSTTTDNSGVYGFSAVSNGTYSITPSKTGYTFSPAFITVIVNGANTTGQNFTATATVVPPNTYNISGAITANGAALSGVSITLSGAGSGSTGTDSSGAYGFSAAPNGTYYITPSKTGYTFSPAFLTVPINGANATGQNFTATATVVTPNTYNISGAITANGNALSGVSLTLSGTGTGSTTTDNSSAYGFSAVPNGTYSITPSKTGYTFSPAFITVSVNGANATGQNFTASATPITATCSEKIPSQQPISVRSEVNPYPSPPSGFSSAMGWVNATLGNGGTTGKVTITNLKLWENINGVKTVIAEKITCPTCSNPDDQVWGFSLDKSLWQVPSAWSKANEGTKFLVSNQSVIAPVASRPSDVYHFWHALWPRPAANTSATYFLTADVFVEGDAMVQIGIDFWQSTSSGTNVEAAVSNWACSSSTAQTIKAGAYH